jgi:hypothetical protein
VRELPGRDSVTQFRAGARNPPCVIQHGASVTITGDALPLLYRAVIALVARHHRDGLSSPPLLHTLRAQLYRATMSRPRHKLVTAAPSSACCTCQDGELVGSAEASRLLAMSRRATQRLAAHDANLLGAVRCGSIWLYRRDAVLAPAERRKAAK